MTWSWVAFGDDTLKIAVPMIALTYTCSRLKGFGASIKPQSDVDEALRPSCRR